MLNGFKEFVLRGNVVELAVAVVVGTAFTALVTAVVEGVINPLIAATAGQPDLTDTWVLVLNGAEIRFGSAIGAMLNFLIIAATVYVLVVMPMNALARRRSAGAEPEPEAPAEDVLLLQEIRDLLAAEGPARHGSST